MLLTHRAAAVLSNVSTLCISLCISRRTLITFCLPFPVFLLPISFSSPANLQQRLLGFMRPDGASSQQVQQELQRKYHSEF